MTLAIVEATGWYEQHKRRNEMHGLHLVFCGTDFTGRGWDVVGEFIIVNGTCRNDGVATGVSWFTKHYQHQPPVKYAAHYKLGEIGIWEGYWNNRTDKGRFEIRLRSSTGHIEEFSNGHAYKK